jgi:hypothetical protein
MKRVFEIDPLVCPRCGGEMRIAAFITNPAQVQRLAANLGVVTWQPPPSLALARAA